MSTNTERARILAKGTVADVAASAATHRIYLDTDTIVPVVKGEVLAYAYTDTPGRLASRIADWYAETRRAPFPDGALLWFRLTEETGDDY